MEVGQLPKPGLSVVIIGRNEGVRLQHCVEAVFAMTRPSGSSLAGFSLAGFKLEVIYVDSASSDGSVELAESMGVQVISVKPSRPTAALGRNAGWRRASAPFILFLDGDTILHPAFVAASLPAFEDEKLAVLCGDRRETKAAASLYNRVLDLDWISEPGYIDSCGGDALMRRDVLELVGGYDEELIAGEEPEMCRRMRAHGYKILRVQRPMTGHDLGITKWKQYWSRATRTGYAYAEVSERFRGSTSPLWEKEAKANRVRATILLLVAVVGVLGSLLLFSVWPVLSATAFFVLLVLRTAVKVGWKSSDPVTRVLYGVHSHLQQIPIFCGQLNFAKDRKASRKRDLIEYKGV